MVSNCFHQLLRDHVVAPHAFLGLALSTDDLLRRSAIGASDSSAGRLQTPDLPVRVYLPVFATRLALTDNDLERFNLIVGNYNQFSIAKDVKSRNSCKPGG